MTNALVQKLETLSRLDDEDRAALLAVSAMPKRVEARTDIIHEGDDPSDVRLILEGFACRYKINEDGVRQIMAYLIPGDFCDLHVFILAQMDHSIGTLDNCVVVNIPRAAILSLLDRPNVARALWLANLVDEATLREWIVNIGSRDAYTRVAHLFCEMHMRLAAIGRVSGGRFILPLTQTEIGDTMGLSSVHVNRTLQSLRQSGLVAVTGRQIEILDIPGLQKMSGFNPNYLHLRKGLWGSADHLQVSPV